MISARVLLRLVYIAVVSLIGCRIVVKAGVQWSGGLTACFAPTAREKDDLDLNDSAIKNERIDDIDTVLLSASYLIIEKHLKSKVKTSDLDQNIRQVEKWLLNEMMAKYSANEPDQVRAKMISTCLSTRLRVHHDALSSGVIMINALQRLRDLKYVKQSGFDCSMAEWHVLEENNRIAMDPIGKLDGQEISENRLPMGRIGNLITVLARQRAEHCLPNYARWLSNPTFPGYKRLKIYWDLIFAHRLKSDRVLLDSPKLALELITSMAHGIEENEVGIVLDFFQRTGVTRFPLNVHVDGPEEIEHLFESELLKQCQTYIHMMSAVFDMIDFDMQSKRFLSRETVDNIVYDPEVAQQRAYCVMCQKLVQEKDRFMIFLRQLEATS